MTEEPKNYSLEKFLPAIPLGGTALAVVFDVGYFWGIGIDFFTFFSLTEHIIFALEALPFAVLVVVIAIIVDALPPRPERFNREPVPAGSLDLLVDRLFELNSEIRAIRKTLTRLRIAMFICGGLTLAYFAYITAWRLFVIVAAMLLTTLLRILAPRRWYASSAASLAFLAVLLTFLFGEFLGASFVGGNTTRYSIVLKTEVVRVVNVARSGDRGVLIVDPATAQVEFLKWDDIKQVLAKPRRSFFDG